MSYQDHATPSSPSQTNEFSPSIIEGLSQAFTPEELNEINTIGHKAFVETFRKFNTGLRSSEAPNIMAEAGLARAIYQVGKATEKNLLFVCEALDQVRLEIENFKKERAALDPQTPRPNQIQTNPPQ